jgi:hypothetical protein
MQQCSRIDVEVSKDKKGKKKKVQSQANSEGRRYQSSTTSRKLNVFVIIHIEACGRPRRSSLTCIPFRNQLPYPKKLQSDACTACTQ